jgi:hypothetical protein
MIDGPQATAAELVRELVSIDLVTLVGEPVFLASVADDHAINSSRACSPVGRTPRAITRPSSCRTEATVAD